MVWARLRFGEALRVDSASLNHAAVLAFFQGRPAFTLRERMFFQVRRLKDAVERSHVVAGAELRLITDFGDLERLVLDHAAGRNVIGAVLGVEGGHSIGDPEQGSDSVDQDMRGLFDLGVRLLGLTHRFDNALAGSSEGCDWYALTPLGRRTVEMAEELGIAIDLAHLSLAGIEELLEMATRPVLNSHTGVQAGCEPPCWPMRNLSDRGIGLILENGGLIGIGMDEPSLRARLEACLLDAAELAAAPDSWEHFDDPLPDVASRGGCMNPDASEQLVGSRVSTTVPLPPPVYPFGVFFSQPPTTAGTPQNAGVPARISDARTPARKRMQQ